MSIVTNKDPDEEFTWEQIPELMEELRQIARQMIRKNSDYSLATTSSLLQTAFRRQKRPDLQLSEVTWKNRRYFFGSMYRAMRHALIDRARVRDRRVRTVSLDDLQIDDPVRAAEKTPEQIDALYEVLDQLEHEKPEWVELIRHRLFGQLTFIEAADLMEITENQARAIWKIARPTLHREILRILNDES